MCSEDDIKINGAHVLEKEYSFFQHLIITSRIEKFDYEVVARFEVQKIMIWPKIQNVKAPIGYKFGQTHKIENIDIVAKQNIFVSGLRQLLLDNRINDFHGIAETEKVYKTCHFVINNKLINCSKVDIRVVDG
jgi:hypothetical protein